MSLLGRLSIVGAPPPPGFRPGADFLARSRAERTYPVVCRNLGIPCELEPIILARQILAREQAREIQREVEAIPLKGLDLAHHLYPSPGLRDMGDLDLLVRPGGLGHADLVLRRLEYRPEFAPQALAGGTLGAALYFRPQSMPVHLHWEVTNSSLPHFMYRIDPEEIWREARDGRMAPHHRFVALCEHALKHSYAELIHLTDLELAGRGLDWERAGETARRWGLEQAVHFALALLRDLGEVRSGAPGGLRGPRLDWAGRAFLSLARSRRFNGLSALGLLSMTREKARFVREAIAPPVREGLRTRSLAGRLWQAAGRLAAGLTS